MSKKAKLLEQATTSVENSRVALPSDSVTTRAEVEGTKRLKNAKLIPLDRIKPDPDQPRKSFDQEKLTELANSIKEHGVLQPITVEFVADDGEGFYKIISGERRYQASASLGLEEIPCIVQSNVSTQKRYAQQLIENIQREDLSPIDKATAILEYREKLGPEAVWADVERTVGISEMRRKQFMALLNLPENIQKEIVATGRKPAKNQITEKHARALLLLNSFPEKQLELFELIKTSPEPITGDSAIAKAKEIKGKKALHHFSLTYKNERELLEKLEEKVKELKSQLEK
ncbi:MAG: ParB/RepB/Spo0J family partition protein [Veillonellaceae bacterium]|nr:ParB/RepB/Spo0J family partition protein [Veillonellaceae bacterium]